MRGNELWIITQPFPDLCCPFNPVTCIQPNLPDAVKVQLNTASSLSESILREGIWFKAGLKGPRTSVNYLSVTGSLYVMQGVISRVFSFLNRPFNNCIYM